MSTRQSAHPKASLARMPPEMGLRPGAMENRHPESPCLWDRAVPGFWVTQWGLVSLSSMADCWDPRERITLSGSQHASVFVTSWQDCMLHQELSG